MSSVTSNYFDDKTPEEIINWMLDKLSEDQIKTCLDQAGIPDTSVIQRPEEPAVVPEDPVTVPEAPVDAPGGSGSDPGPPSTFDLDNLRRMCKNKLVLIDSVSGDMVSFYEFGPDENGDLNWKKTVSQLQNFIENNCSEENVAAANEILELDESDKEEMAPGLVSSVPVDVKRLANDYLILGLEQPLDPKLLTQRALDVTDPQSQIVYDETVSDAIKKQLSLDSVLKKNYPVLHTTGLTKFPIFVHSVSEDGKISYISLVLKDDNTFDFRERKNGSALFLTQVKRDLKELADKIEAAAATGWSKPNDYASEIDTALSTWSKKREDNMEIYNKILVNYSPARLVQLRNSITSSFGEMVYKEYYSDEPKMATYFSGVKASISSTNKNVRDLNNDELHTRMRTLFGKEYAQKHEPFITYNKFGIKTVQYRKKTGSKSDKHSSHNDGPVFGEFGTE
jgi:hypothetical protein